jgi:hypothetical protein
MESVSMVRHVFVGVGIVVIARIIRVVIVLDSSSSHHIETGESLQVSGDDRS